MSKIILGDCHNVLDTMDPDIIDMVCFSPPYDNLRTYGGNAVFDFGRLAVQVLRVIKPGGVCAMVIQDATVKGTKTLTSFRTAVQWVDLGWRLWETCIYSRQGVPGIYTNLRPRVDHEYIHLFVRGDCPPFYQNEHMKSKMVTAGRRLGAAPRRQKDGSMRRSIPKTLGEMKNAGTILDYGSVGGVRPELKGDHPATFPDALAADLIQAFSRHGETVLDVMCGSGTTPVMAQIHGRIGIGIEIHEPYVKIARHRLHVAMSQLQFTEEE